MPFGLVLRRSLDAEQSLDQRPSTLGMIPDGVAGIRETLRLMTRIVRKFKKDPELREFTCSLIAHLPPKAWTAEANALFIFVRDQIRYVFDPVDVETVCDPPVTLQIGQGDCDDKVVLLGSMLECIGHPVRFVAVGYNFPNFFEHVYLETKIGANWIACETTEECAPLGWCQPDPTARLVWDV